MDLIEHASDLLYAIESTDKNKCICDSCDVEEWLPEMVAEIKRLREYAAIAEEEGFYKGLEEKQPEIDALKEQLATWQKIAIEERAGHICDNYTHCDFDEEHRKQAAKELGLQVRQEAGYLERLERLAFINVYRSGMGPRGL